MTGNGNIREIPQKEGDVVQVLERLAARPELKKAKAVIVVLEMEDGSQEAWTSDCSGYQKVWLVSFLGAWINKQFFDNQRPL